jgi:flagellar hook-associated protein 2
MAAVTLSGFNGIDFNTIISSVMQAESQPLIDLQSQQSALQTKDSAYVSLGASISRFQAPITALTSATAFSNVAATSTDTAIGTVSLGDGGLPGQYDVVIDHLAKGQVTSSTNGYAATSAVAATGGTISFTIEGEPTDDITISATTTLAELKEQINNQDSAVFASIVNDGTNYKLVISSRETGLTNGFTINNSLTNTSGTVVAFAVGQNATTGNTQNAINAGLTVNGISISSASNTLVDAVPGVTVSMLKAGTMSVKVSQDFTTIKDNLKTLVTEYNKLRQFAAQQANGPLKNDSVLREVLNDIKSVLLTSNSNGGRYHYMSEIGLEVMQSGDLKLDETKLNTAINSYSSDLEKLFQGTGGGNGVLDNLKTTVANLDGTAGLIKSTRSSLETSIKSMRDRVSSQQLRLEIRRRELMKMYTAADQAMSQLKAAGGQLANLGTQSLF